MKRWANIPLTISMYVCAIEGVLSVSGGIWIKLSKSVVDMPLLHLLRDTSQYHRCFLHVDGKAFNAQYKKYNRRNAGPGKIWLHAFNYNVRKSKFNFQSSSFLHRPRYSLLSLANDFRLRQDLWDYYNIQLVYTINIIHFYMCTLHACVTYSRWSKYKLVKKWQRWWWLSSLYSLYVFSHNTFSCYGFTSIQLRKGITTPSGIISVFWVSALLSPTAVSTLLLSTAWVVLSESILTGKFIESITIYNSKEIATAS